METETQTDFNQAARSVFGSSLYRTIRIGPLNCLFELFDKNASDAAVCESLQNQVMVFHPVPTTIVDFAVVYSILARTRGPGHDAVAIICNEIVQGLMNFGYLSPDQTAEVQTLLARVLPIRGTCEYWPAKASREVVTAMYKARHGGPPVDPRAARPAIPANRLPSLPESSPTAPDMERLVTQYTASFADWVGSWTKQMRRALYADGEPMYFIHRLISDMKYGSIDPTASDRVAKYAGDMVAARAKYLEIYNELAVAKLEFEKDNAKYGAPEAVAAIETVEAVPVAAPAAAEAVHVAAPAAAEPVAAPAAVEAVPDAAAEAVPDAAPAAVAEEAVVAKVTQGGTPDQLGQLAVLVARLAELIKACDASHSI